MEMQDGALEMVVQKPHGTWPWRTVLLEAAGLSFTAAGVIGMAGIEADGSGDNLFRGRRCSDTARLVMASVPASWAVALALARCCTGGR